MTSILGMQLNGGSKNALIGIASATAIGVGGYVMTAVSHVEPLIQKTKLIEKQIDTQFDGLQRRWDDQKNWDNLFIDEQKHAHAEQIRTNDKLDQLIEIVRNKP